MSPAFFDHKRTSMDSDSTRVHMEAANALIRSGFERAARACDLTLVADPRDATLIVQAELGEVDDTITRLIIDENGIRLEAPLTAEPETLQAAIRLSLAVLRFA